MGLLYFIFSISAHSKYVQLPYEKMQVSEITHRKLKFFGHHVQTRMQCYTAFQSVPATTLLCSDMNEVPHCVYVGVYISSQRTEEVFCLFFISDTYLSLKIIQNEGEEMTALTHSLV